MTAGASAPSGRGPGAPRAGVRVAAASLALACGGPAAAPGPSPDEVLLAFSVDARPVEREARGLRVGEHVLLPATPPAPGASVGTVEPGTPAPRWVALLACTPTPSIEVFEVASGARVATVAPRAEDPLARPVLARCGPSTR